MEYYGGDGLEESRYYSENLAFASRGRGQFRPRGPSRRGDPARRSLRLPPANTWSVRPRGSPAGPLPRGSRLSDSTTGNFSPLYASTYSSSQDQRYRRGNNQPIWQEKKRKFDYNNSENLKTKEELEKMKIENELLKAKEVQMEEKIWEMRKAQEDQKFEIKEYKRSCNCDEKDLLEYLETEKGAEEKKKLEIENDFLRRTLENLKKENEEIKESLIEAKKLQKQLESESLVDNNKFDLDKQKLETDLKGLTVENVNYQKAFQQMNKIMNPLLKPELPQPMTNFKCEYEEKELKTIKTENLSD